MPEPTKKIMSMLVYARGPESIMYEGEATAITAINDKGPFDILPGHENFISMIKQMITIFTREGEKKEAKIDSGILKVQGNQVHIFLGIETLTPPVLESSVAQPGK